MRKDSDIDIWFAVRIIIVLAAAISIVLLVDPGVTQRVMEAIDSLL